MKKSSTKFIQKQTHYQMTQIHIYMSIYHTVKFLLIRGQYYVHPSFVQDVLAWYGMYLVLIGGFASLRD